MVTSTELLQFYQKQLQVYKYYDQNIARPYQ